LIGEFDDDDDDDNDDNDDDDDDDDDDVAAYVYSARHKAAPRHHIWNSLTT
jgi:hypothetical protein